MSYKSIAVAAILIMLCSAMAGWWGFKQGQKYGATIESVSFAHISTAQIDRLRSGKPEEIEKVVSLFDIYINHGVDRFYWYTESGNGFLGELLFEGYEQQLVKAMRGVASYRAEHPETDASSSLSGEVRESYIEGYITRQAVVELMAGK